MKLILFFCSLILIVFAVSCSSSCKIAKVKEGFIIENSEAKVIKKVTYQLWNGGTEASGSGYNMVIDLAKSDKKIELDNIYFRHSKAAIKTTTNGFKANLKIEKHKDIQLSSNPSDEYNNELPQKDAFPFQLNDNECIISYFENDRSKFIRVSNLKELETINYPSARPKN